MITKPQNKRLVKKRQAVTKNPMHYSRTMTTDNLSKAANTVGELILTGLGKAGQAFNELLTSGASTDFGQTSPFVMSSVKERRVIQKGKLTALKKANEKITQGMTWISPLNYGAAVWNGHGLNAKKGEEEIASWSPAWQAVGRVGELYLGPKVVKEIKSTPKAVVNVATKAEVKPVRAVVIPEKRITYQPKLLLEVPTSLKFFERKPANISEAERAGATKWDRNFKPKWHVANYPGYLLKGLMKGSRLEKLLYKNGTININQLNAYFNKASQVEKDVANKVLAEKFNGLKTIDYNLFKKTVLDELITYSIKPEIRHSTYGMDRLGFNAIKESDGAGGIVEYLPGVRTNTFTFESPKIPVGNSRHYNLTTLGHSRTYTTPGEPKILHVMESQSDWALNKPIELFKEHGIKNLLDLDDEINFQINNAGAGYVGVNWKNRLQQLKNSREYLIPQGKHLSANYLQRQLQENLRYAAENGLTKMRYPTSETAAKIEGYLKVALPRPTRNREIELTDLLDKMWKEYYDANESQLNNTSLLELELIGRKNIPNYAKLMDELEQLKSIPNKYEYTPAHQTILKKYADFPKLFLKLYKGLDVKTITDTKGNTWYEVNVPKGYLNSEWLFKQGGKIRKMLTAAGGPINTIDIIRRKLYKNITPFGYHNPISRTLGAVVLNKQDDTRANENKRIKNSVPEASALDAIWATYLNIPKNQRRVINPKYGISKTKDGYYKFNSPEIILNFKLDLSPQGLFRLPGKKTTKMNGILGNYTTGLGRDNKGDYIFYSDSKLNSDGTPNIKTGWDINPYSNPADTEETTEEHGQYGLDKKDLSYRIGKALFGNKEDLSMGIGTPVPIYDKIYLDDIYNIPEKERGGYYLPEIIVTRKKK